MGGYLSFMYHLEAEYNHPDNPYYKPGDDGRKIQHGVSADG